MSTRKKISIAVLFCLPILTIWLVVPMLLPEIDTESPFKGNQAVLPNISYSEVIQNFSRAHKPFLSSTTISPTGEVVPEDNSEVMKLIETAIEESNFELPVFGDLAINPVYSAVSVELNTYLYYVCQLYASGMQVGDIELSPLLALAEANLEGGRVDRSQTFSGMAPTSVFTFNSAEELRAFNVTDVLQSEETWRAMSSEYSTRDRGPLQCLPSYAFNRQEYGPSESALLSKYVEENGCPDYGTNKDSLGVVFSVQDWINYSRTAYGDRFNVESIIHMFADEKREVEIPGILRNFGQLQNEYHVYAIMAYNHWCGSGYMTMSNDTPYAGFQTIGRSKEYCEAISSPAAIEIIYSQCVQEIQRARDSGQYPVRCLDKKSGRALFDVLVEQGVCKEWDYYFRHKRTGSWDQGATACSYPLGLIYGVMQMNLLYSGY